MRSYHGSHNCSNICSHDNASAGQRNRVDGVIELDIVEHIIADHYSNLELINSIIHAISNDENHDNNNNSTNNNNHKRLCGNGLNNNMNNNNNKISKQHLNFNDNASIEESDKSSLQIEGHNYNEYGADGDIDLDNIIQQSPSFTVTVGCSRCIK